jgi:hypothetical protein
LGDTGTNLVTGQANQMLPMMDPDSLKLLPNGDLLLTGEADGAYIFVKDPGTAHQTESFVLLPTGDVPDDAIMPTSRSGTFYISNQGGNDVISVQVTGLNTHDLYADVSTPSGGELVQIDPDTGAITPVVTGLSAPHGLAFVPSVAGKPDRGSAGGADTADGTQIGNIALLANYMAASFAPSSDGHGGTLMSEAAQGNTQPVLVTHPHA